VNFSGGSTPFTRLTLPFTAEAGLLRLGEAILQGEAGMARLIAAHEPEEIAHIGILRALAHLGIEHAARELRRDGADEEVAELLVELGRQVRELRVKLLVAHEMTLVGIRLQLRDQLVPLRAH
jgi:hypothetical protein